MSYKKLNRGGFGQAKTFTKERDRVEGYLCAMKCNFTGRGKEKRKFHVFTLLGAGGERLDFFGSSAIDRELLDDTGELHSDLLGKKIRITMTGTRKLRGRPQPMKMFDVEYDPKDSINVKKDIPFSRD